MSSEPPGSGSQVANQWVRYSHPPHDAMTIDVRRYSPDRFARQAIRLTIVSGPDVGREIPLDAEEISIGTASDCHVVLTDPTASRRHCVIKKSPSGLAIHDLGSTNGTWLSGCRISSAHLEPGVVVELGCTRIRMDALSDAPPAWRDTNRYGLLIGRSRAMRQLFARLEQIAGASTTVLILGETGTGKDVIAETIHCQSMRAHGPLVTFDCARVTPTLMESELFGHVRGAFTGANTDRPGLFESAHGGTAFLDEIGELPLDLQPKLLRVLERRTSTRIGAVRAQNLDVRIIAATNRDLRQTVADGEFRSDLYYRLNVMTLHVPPLRERLEDIPLLGNHFLQQIAGNPTAELPRDVVARMQGYAWPGNIRELRAAVERWHILRAGARMHDVPMFGQDLLEGNDSSVDQSFHDLKSRAMDEWERGFLYKLMSRHNGNVSAAARAAQMNRNHLSNLLRRHGVAA